MTWFTPVPGGVRIAVRVVPRAARTKAAGLHGNALKIRLSSPPVDGRANAALIAFISERLGVPRSAIRIERGESSRDKILSVRIEPSAFDPHALWPGR